MTQSNATRRFTMADLRARIIIVDGCWVWQGHTNKQGYGRIKWGGKRFMTTHRLAFAVANGLDVNDLSPSVVIRHTCDNPPCINPDHLLSGTHADNVRDMIERGRARFEFGGGYRGGGGHYVRIPKTHCVNGHEFTPENTRIDSHGQRCRECNRVWCRQYYDKIRKGVNKAMTTPVEPDAPEDPTPEPDDD